MLQWAAFGVTVIVLGLLAIRKPLWLVPLLGFSVALEISSTWYPGLGAVGRILGIVSLTRFVSIALIFAVFIRLIAYDEMRRKLGDILRDPLTIIVIIYLVIAAASVIYSADPGKTVNETVRLLVLFAVFISCALLLDKDKALLPFVVVHFTALALAPLTFYEGFTGQLIWQQDLLLREVTLRVNATFVDPNIFARFLVLGIVANLVLQLHNRSKGAQLAYMACLAVLLAQLAFTSSRGGLLTLIAVLFVALIILPNRKAILWIFGLGAFFSFLVVFIQPEIIDRILTLFQDPEVSNPQRMYLWKAAIAIFQDHTITGSGLGTFQTVFLRDYAHLQTVPDGATLSHTTILTIAAELGVIGLTLLVLFWIALIGRLYGLYSPSNSFMSIFSESSTEYHIGAGAFLWVLAVFISSQGEGRFFEDPIMWLGLALLVILKMRRQYRIYTD